MRGPPVGFQRFQVHPGQGPDYFEMTQLLCSDIHQEILPFGIIAIEALDRILHGGGQFTVGTPELLKKHVPKAGIRDTDMHCVH
jgi:hypothetical protein